MVVAISHTTVTISYVSHNHVEKVQSHLSIFAPHTSIQDQPSHWALVAYVETVDAWRWCCRHYCLGHSSQVLHGSPLGISFTNDSFQIFCKPCGDAKVGYPFVAKRLYNELRSRSTSPMSNVSKMPFPTLHMDPRAPSKASTTLL